LQVKAEGENTGKKGDFGLLRNDRRVAYGNSRQRPPPHLCVREAKRTKGLESWPIAGLGRKGWKSGDGRKSAILPGIRHGPVAARKVTAVCLPREQMKTFKRQKTTGDPINIVNPCPDGRKRSTAGMGLFGRRSVFQ